jgi:hypothetical protein
MVKKADCASLVTLAPPHPIAVMRALDSDAVVMVVDAASTLVAPKLQPLVALVSMEH